MKVINLTRRTILSQKVFIADRFFSRLKGLLGRKKLDSEEALFIKPANSIHTFFMRFPIDVIFLDKELKVVDLIESLSPWRLSRVYFRANSVLELPSGKIKLTFTQKGDQLIFTS